MARTLRVPSNCSNIILAASGSQNPAAELIATITAAELVDCVHHTTKPSLVRAAANGNVDIKLPLSITGADSITIAGASYTPDADGIITGVPAAAASAFLYQNFSLVLGQ